MSGGKDSSLLHRRIKVFPQDSGSFGKGRSAEQPHLEQQQERRAQEEEKVGTPRDGTLRSRRRGLRPLTLQFADEITVVEYLLSPAERQIKQVASRAVGRRRLMNRQRPESENLQRDVGAMLALDGRRLRTMHDDVDGVGGSAVRQLFRVPPTPMHPVYARSSSAHRRNGHGRRQRSTVEAAAMPSSTLAPPSCSSSSPSSNRAPGEDARLPSALSPAARRAASPGAPLRPLEASSPPLAASASARAAALPLKTSTCAPTYWELIVALMVVVKLCTQLFVGSVASSTPSTSTRRNFRS